jgi:HEPN domain-containing protein
MNAPREDVRAWVRKVAFPKTHDLLRLLQLCQRRDALLQSLHPFLEFLNAYSVLVRYPGEEPTLDEAREVRQVLRQRLGLQNRSG